MKDTIRIRPADADENAALAALYAEACRELPYKPLDTEAFVRLFRPDEAELPYAIYVAETADGRLAGFVQAVLRADPMPVMTYDEAPGYISFIYVEKASRRQGIGRALLAAGENFLTGRGKRRIELRFFNPVTLRWCIPGTNAHEHPNAPGVFRDTPGEAFFAEEGYGVLSRETAYHLDLAGYAMPEALLAREKALAAENITIGEYDPRRHVGVDEFFDHLQNEYWRADFAAAVTAKDPLPMLVALDGDKVIGFAGPVDVEPCGRGYFGGIGVDPGYEGRGIGAVLFARLMDRFARLGAGYSTLFTGEENSAARIYLRTGFASAAHFDCMYKDVAPGKEPGKRAHGDKVTEAEAGGSFRREIEALGTESVNADSAEIDRCSTLEMLQIINRADAQVAAAVEKALPEIARAVDAVAQRLEAGGHLYYFGAGTSGRLGVLDASECPPTYGVDPSLVQGYIAGGDRALRKAAEGSEDDRAAGQREILDHGITSKDAVVGISASGHAPYVLGVMEAAREAGALVIGLATNAGTVMEGYAQIMIAPVVGAEVIAGSTRMKSGTAQKMVLNMLSTGVMIRLGKVYGNRMVDLRATNEKLRIRAVNMVSDLTGADTETAARALEAAGGQVKTAVLMLCRDLSAKEASARLAACKGRLRQALETRDKA